MDDSDNNTPADATQSGGSYSPVTRSKNGKYRGKTRLITRKSLDRRTKAAAMFDDVVNGIVSDLGGEDRLSTVQKHLVEAFAGAAINVQDMNARLALGQKVDLVQHATAISTMVRLAHRIGVERQAKDVTQPKAKPWWELVPDEDAPTAVSEAGGPEVPPYPNNQS